MQRRTFYQEEISMPFSERYKLKEISSQIMSFKPDFRIFLN